MKDNIILMADRYAYGHYLQMPAGVEYAQSYVEARGSHYQNMLFFGLQAFVSRYIEPGLTKEMVDEAEMILRRDNQPFNREGFMYIVEELDGQLPIEIAAVPEGSVIPVGNVMATITNTEPGFAWLPSFIEAGVLRSIWYGSTVATNSAQLRQLLLHFAGQTATSTDHVPFQVHDFGARGASSEESARIGGAAHLVCFYGSDTIAAERFIREYYPVPQERLDEGYVISTGIPAAQHSTITAWGKDQEHAAFSYMVEEFTSNYSGAVSVVSDSYDQEYAIEVLWGEHLREQVQNCGGTVVVRTDSGDPVKAPVEAIRTLLGKYGYTTNEKGYRVLPNCIRVIHSDGMGIDAAHAVLASLAEVGISSENIVFGIGGALLQDVLRDDSSMAMKTSHIQFEDGEIRETYKDPVTAPGKKSKSGVLDLVYEDGNYRTIDRREEMGTSALEDVYSPGVGLMTQHGFHEIRERAWANIKE